MSLTSGNKTLAESSEALTQRLGVLKRREPAQKVETEQKPGESSLFEGGAREVRVTTTAKEKALALTFGDEEYSSQNLRLFLEHFELAKKQNVRRGVDILFCAKFQEHPTQDNLEVPFRHQRRRSEE